MCGIFGVIQKNKPISPEKMDVCVGMLNHRGPDHQKSIIASTTTQTDEIYLGFGHTRLSIIDLDPRSHQPFQDEQGNTLVYNGEIYNFQDVKKALFPKEIFKTSGDTELLHKMLCKHGLDKMNDLAGMWAFSFWIPSDKKVLMSRDRFGKKPLFYYHDNETFCFSSAIRPILTYLDKSATFSHDAIAAYLNHKFMVPANDGSTYIPFIREIRASHHAHLDLKSWELTETRYFRPEDHLYKQTTDEDWLAATLEEAVLSRLISDRPVGLLLSGGIDSTLILSILAKHQKLDQVRCFIGDTGVSDDAHYAATCAKELDIKPTVLNMDYGTAAFDRFLNICRHHEKPFLMSGNALAMPEMYHAVSQTDIKVVLDGSGGDEIFGGYWDRYAPFLIREAQTANHSEWLNAVYDNNKDDPRIGKILAPLLRGDTVQSINQTSATHRYLSSETLSIPSPDPLHQFGGSFTEALLIDSSAGGRLGEWLWHNDRNAMMFGLENRSPFLDHRLIPAIGTRYDQKFNGAWNKYELRKIYDRFVPLPTQWRQQKQGFRWKSNWFIEENQGKVLDLIQSSTLLSSFMNVPLLIDDIKNKKITLKHELLPRALCVAAIEKVMES